MLNYKRPLNTIAYSTAIGAGIGFYGQAPFSRAANAAMNSFEPKNPVCAIEEKRVQELTLFGGELLIPHITTIAGFALGTAIATTDLLIQLAWYGLGRMNEEPRRAAIPA